jgi:hypothetical protein
MAVLIGVADGITKSRHAKASLIVEMSVQKLPATPASR